jgi:TfoX/Sxy family transcriptional regulator of competence genes
MKCLKNKQTGNIIRVDDKQAYQMAGSTWEYVAKAEWKKLVRDVKTEKQEVESEKKEETLSEKALKRKKLKEKQRA